MRVHPTCVDVEARRTERGGGVSGNDGDVLAVRVRDRRLDGMSRIACAAACLLLEHALLGDRSDC